MAFKIKNITDLLEKRNPNLNQALLIEYVDGFTKKEIILEVGKDLILEKDILPISLHKFQVKGLIQVDFLDEQALQALKNK